jgi:hypothetical protein
MMADTSILVADTFLVRADIFLMMANTFLIRASTFLLSFTTRQNYLFRGNYPKFIANGSKTPVVRATFALIPPWDTQYQSLVRPEGQHKHGAHITDNTAAHGLAAVGATQVFVEVWDVQRLG